MRVEQDRHRSAALPKFRLVKAHYIAFDPGYSLPAIARRLSRIRNRGHFGDWPSMLGDDEYFSLRRKFIQNAQTSRLEIANPELTFLHSSNLTISTSQIVICPPAIQSRSSGLAEPGSVLLVAEFAHERHRWTTPVVGRLQRFCGREVGRRGIPRHVRGPSGIHRDGSSYVGRRAAQVRRVD